MCVLPMIKVTVQRYLQEKNRNSTTHSHFLDQFMLKGLQCILKVGIANFGISPGINWSPVNQLLLMPFLANSDKTLFLDIIDFPSITE